jgi:hypothetical protein
VAALLGDGGCPQLGDLDLDLELELELQLDLGALSCSWSGCVREHGG